MESYPIDIDPDQVVRWLLAEQATGTLPVWINALQHSEIREIDTQQDIRLSDEERDGLSEAATVAMLEIVPRRASEGWRLTIVVEDEAGPRMVGAGSGEERPIDLGAFHRRYLRPDRGTVSLTAEVEDSDGKAHLDRLLRTIETNSHPDSGRAHAPS